LQIREVYTGGKYRHSVPFAPRETGERGPPLGELIEETFYALWGCAGPTSARISLWLPLV
jgi:hypothetical protein